MSQTQQNPQTSLLQPLTLLQRLCLRLALLLIPKTNRWVAVIYPSVSWSKIAPSWLTPEILHEQSLSPTLGGRLFNVLLLDEVSR